MLADIVLSSSATPCPCPSLGIDARGMDAMELDVMGSPELWDFCAINIGTVVGVAWDDIAATCLLERYDIKGRILLKFVDAPLDKTPTI